MGDGVGLEGAEPERNAMKPWERIDAGPVPGAKAEMVLLRRDDEFVIRVDGHTLMGSRMHGSEDALADMAFDHLGQREDARVLVGGLGMGFTAAAALRRAAPSAVVVAAELVPKVIEWNRGPLAAVADRPLEDPRLQIHAGDVLEVIRNGDVSWDAIILDIDNGPRGLSSPSNQWLYGRQGLKALYGAAKPGGMVGVWSASPDRVFTARMEQAGFETTVATVRARGSRGGPRHTIWIGVRPG